MQPLEPPPPPKQHKSSSVSVVAAGCLGVVIVLGFAVLMMAALGGGTSLGLILFGTIALSVLALHYVLWGWWLGPILREQAEQEEEARRELE